jgi:thiol:disulfide interchange protein DsbA
MKLKTLMMSAAFGAAGLFAATHDAAAQSASGPVSAAGFVAGQNYKVLSPAQPTSSSADQVEVAEFFMYSCPHCYHFEPYVQDWLKTKPDYVNFIRIPTVWNDLVKLHAEAFYSAQALGKGEEMHEPFFEEMHERNNYLQSMDSVAEFFGRFGVDRETVAKTMDSFSVHTKVQRADELARRYRVDSTPSIVVNGKYLTNATMAGGFDRLIDLVNALTAEEEMAGH